jgi:hypothetical protein
VGSLEVASRRHKGRVVRTEHLIISDQRQLIGIEIVWSLLQGAMKLSIADLRRQRAYHFNGDAILQVKDVGDSSAETVGANHFACLGGNEFV